jgi:hypothetical protein
LEEPPFIEGAVVEPAETAYTPPPAPEYRAPAAPQAPSNRGLAVAVEIIAGIFFFLGIGWMIAGKLGVGIGLLVGYWIAVAIYAVILTILSPFTLGFSFLGLCLLPIVPVVSGLILNEKMK